MRDTQEYLPGIATSTDVLGRTRPIAHVYPDGSFNCPFCGSAVIAPETDCHNPACFAWPGYPVAIAEQELAKLEARQRAEAERKANHEAAMIRIREEQDARRAHIATIYHEADQRGACRRCLWSSSSYAGFIAPKFVKHRGVCPRAK